MPEEPKKDVPEQDGNQANKALDEVNTIIDLKKQIEELTNKNKELEETKKKVYDRILNGGEGQEVPEKKHRPISEIRKDLIATFSDDKETTNLAYCKLALELDNAVREDTGESVFLPKGKNITPTVDEIATADRFHDLLTDAIEASGDDPISFNAELEKHIKKPTPIKTKK